MAAVLLELRRCTNFSCDRRTINLHDINIIVVRMVYNSQYIAYLTKEANYGYEETDY